MTAGRLLTITCRAVHHVGCHAVGRSLRVHQARAVVHRLSVGGAGSHNAALIHGRKIALPRRGEHIHNLITDLIAEDAVVCHRAHHLSFVKRKQAISSFYLCREL